jgi:hypothetical protein
VGLLIKFSGLNPVDFYLNWMTDTRAVRTTNFGALVNVSKASRKCTMNKSLFGLGVSGNRKDTNDKEGA